jgi:hypothetical protein
MLLAIGGSSISLAAKAPNAALLLMVHNDDGAGFGWLDI